MTGFHVHHVKSSNLKTIAYDGKTLRVTFASGQTWNYAEVPEHVHKELLGAESKGSYFARMIRDKYKGAKHVET
jgi:KTSC domain